MATLIVSPSPHVHSGDSVSKNMYNVVIALLPAYLVSLYFFGLGALVVSLVSMVSCVLFEYLIQRFVFKGKTTVWNGSALLTGMLLSFNLPSNLPWCMVVIGAFVALVIVNMSFGGLGNNIFNPALVGRVFLLVSFPAAMTTWPVPTPFSLHYTDAETGATVLAMLKGGFGELPSHIDMMVGNMGGSLGEVSAVALIIGGIYLMIRKVITWHIPVSILLTVAVFTGILHACNPAEFASPLVHLLSGGLMLGAFFMATDYVTSPMTHRGQLIFGFGIGVITVVIRTWGAYPEGVSFAILIMNAVTPLINTYVKPRRFGEKVKK